MIKMRLWQTAQNLDFVSWFKFWLCIHRKTDRFESYIEMQLIRGHNIETIHASFLLLSQIKWQKTKEHLSFHNNKIKKGNFKFYFCKSFSPNSFQLKLINKDFHQLHLSQFTKTFNCIKRFNKHRFLKN